MVCYCSDIQRNSRRIEVIMEVYVISPVSNLEPMKLGDRIFALAHLWVKYPHYRSFILQQKREGKFVTLDNSAAERALVTEDVLVQVCHELMPDEVIAPDVLFDSESTIQNAIAFKKRLEREGLLGKISIFFCPQGENREDWIRSYLWALSMEWVDVIGFSKIAIPRAFLPTYQDDQDIKLARHMAYDYLHSRGLLSKPIHCLGQGSPTEFSHYTHPAMRSTDSVYPILAAANGQDFYDNHNTRIPTPHDFLETYDMSSIDMDMVKSNVTFLRHQCASI